MEIKIKKNGRKARPTLLELTSSKEFLTVYDPEYLFDPVILFHKLFGQFPNRRSFWVSDLTGLMDALTRRFSITEDNRIMQEQFNPAEMVFQVESAVTVPCPRVLVFMQHDPEASIAEIYYAGRTIKNQLTGVSDLIASYSLQEADRRLIGFDVGSRQYCTNHKINPPGKLTWSQNTLEKSKKILSKKTFQLRG